MRGALNRILEEKIEQFKSINAFDERKRLGMLRGTIQYTKDHDAEMLGLYRFWLESCEQYISDIVACEQHGCHLRNYQQFLECVTNAEGILAVDADFFSSIKLSELRDQAIDEFRSGRCEPV